MDGYLLVDKPAGLSSFGVVARVRGIIKAETGQKIKIGHTGTLDPVATGLMILVLGKYTKRAAEFSKLDKIYEVEAKLGFTSTTGDTEGEIKKTSDVKPSDSEISSALEKFKGEVMQTPPIYSAMKIDGQRAYKLARAGKEVTLQPRKAKIFSIDDVNYKYPQFKFTAHVGSGTYIRSLVEDIGLELGVGAYITALRRTEVGSYSLQTAIVIDGLTLADIAKHLKS